jgi:predicted PurR-regulated permease PerM
VSRPPPLPWLPHAILIALVVGSAMWLMVLLAPVTKALAVGASLALLTHGPLYRRLHALTHWWPWPNSHPEFAASTAIAVLGAASAAAVLALLWAALGGLQLTVSAVWGIAIHDQASVQQVIEVLTARAAEVLQLYPQLPITTVDVRQWLADILQQTAVGPAFLKTMVAGGGSAVVELILTSVVTWWLYVQGAVLGRRILHLLPAAEREPISGRLRERAGALVWGTFGRAFVVGVWLGLASWLTGDFPPVLVAAVGVLVCVMPLLGPVFVWLPLASLLAGQGHWLQAGLLAVSSQVGAMLLNWILDRRYAQAPLAGTGPVLLLTLVGGLWGFGPRGLILAPAALVLALSAWDALTSLYSDDPQLSEGGQPAVDDV